MNQFTETTLDCIPVKQGEDFEWLLVVCDPVTEEPTSALGYTFQGQIRETRSSKILLASWTFEIMEDTNPLLIGQVKMKLAKAVSSAIKVPKAVGTDLSPLKWVFGIEMYDGSRELQVKQGVLDFYPEVCK